MHPSDSEDNVDIGLSSEEKAEDLPDDVHIRRKFVPPPQLLNLSRLPQHLSQLLPHLQAYRYLWRHYRRSRSTLDSC